MRQTKHGLMLMLLLPAFTTTLVIADEPSLPAGVVLCLDDSTASSTSLAFRSVQPSVQSPTPFCMNDGTCKANVTANFISPCECIDGRAGPHCEFANENAVPACTLDCQNGGVCQAGIQSFDQTSFTYNGALQYCICPPGLYGELCEIAGDPCGSHHCYNGGTCTAIPQDDGTVEEYCDCSTGTTSSKSYAGPFCEHESTSFCSRFDDVNGRQFCVNGGTCKGDSHLGCDCLDGFVGPVCEFVDKGIEPYTCSLQCKNNGICRKGAKDLSILKQFGFGDRRRHRRLQDDVTNIDQAHNENFEHCVCPQGYAGLQCEYDVDICPGGQHVCLNGARCDPVRTDTGLHYECDCTLADTSTVLFAGRYCEYKSTEYCTHSGVQPEDAFCTNNGECKKLVGVYDQHPGCECDSAFEGPHCEYLAGTWNHAASSEQQAKSSHRKTTALVTIGVLVIAAAVVGLFYSHRRRRRNGRPRTIVPQFVSQYTDVAPAPTVENLQELDPHYIDRGEMMLEIDEVDEEEEEDDHDSDHDFDQASRASSRTATATNTAASGNFTQTTMAEEDDSINMGPLMMEPEGNELVVFQDSSHEGIV